MIRLPAPRTRKRRWWTVDEARLFLESTRLAQEPLYAAFVLILVLGLRKGEVESQVSTQPRPTAGTMAGANLAQLPGKDGGRASRPAMTTPSGGKIPEIT